MRTHQGAVMIADITGFTALTEDLGRQGALGVELLTRCMNNYFTLVMELVRPFLRPFRNIPSCCWTRMSDDDPC
jgi:class 3 adenylate cyclase